MVELHYRKTVAFPKLNWQCEATHTAAYRQVQNYNSHSCMSAPNMEHLSFSHVYAISPSKFPIIAVLDTLNSSYLCPKIIREDINPVTGYQIAFEAER